MKLKITLSLASSMEGGGSFFALTPKTLFIVLTDLISL